LLPPPVTPAVNSEAEAANIGLPPTVLTSPETDIPVVAPDLENIIPPPALIPDLTAPIPEVEGSSIPLPVELVESTPVQEVETTIAVNTPQQTSLYQLIHLQTNIIIEIPPQLQVVNVGKPNYQVAPDIDVSSFPCAEVVSRIHANIRVEGENYYIEDVGSANGTYINHNVLAKGNRHLLRAGDRIGLGKGDLVTFLFQSSV
jgi:FHA domain